MDNLFVFVLVFGYFKTLPAAQNKVLTWGIVSAAVLRAIMILLGIDLITSFRSVGISSASLPLSVPPPLYASAFLPFCPCRYAPPAELRAVMI